jgi:hypothetical protein
MSATAVFKNNSRYDVIVAGSCSLLNKKGSKKLMQVKIAQKLIVQPKQKTPITCNFGSALPRGKYKIQGNYKVKIKGLSASVKANKRQNIKIDKQLAKQIAGRGSVDSQSVITTPLLLSQTMIQQEVVGGKARKVTLEIVNPTSKRMNITSKFRVTNNNRVKVIFKPRKFKLSAGSSKRISIDFKSKDKKAPIYGWLEFSSKQAKGAPPATIPVILVPEGLKQKHNLAMSDVSIVLTSGGTRVAIKTVTTNRKNGKEALYLTSNTVITNIETGIIVETIKGSVSNDNLLPGNKVALTSAIDFDKLKDGVYQLIISLVSEEGGANISKKVNVVINRDIAQKIKVVVNE